MSTRTVYSGIDVFRLVAALLVVAIHTSPLASISADADFLLTRVLARLGVPFFFMASGFFVLERRGAVTRFLKRTALLYLAAIVLYLPVNGYMGSFRGLSLRDLAQLVLVDGTLYHLWYLPAVMTGVLIAVALLRLGGLRAALIVAALLYLIGLGGDSYYGLVAQCPALEGFYAQLFQICDYTRNGFFFAPLFLLLGACCARHPRSQSSTSTLGFVVTLLLMAAEASLLRARLATPRQHDSVASALRLLSFSRALALHRPIAALAARGRHARVHPPSADDSRSAGARRRTPRRAAASGLQPDLLSLRLPALILCRLCPQQISPAPAAMSLSISHAQLLFSVERKVR